MILPLSLVSLLYYISCLLEYKAEIYNFKRNYTTLFFYLYPTMVPMQKDCTQPHLYGHIQPFLQQPLERLYFIQFTYIFSTPSVTFSPLMFHSFVNPVTPVNTTSSQRTSDLITSTFLLKIAVTLSLPVAETLM